MFYLKREGIFLIREGVFLIREGVFCSDSIRNIRKYMTLAENKLMNMQVHYLIGFEPLR